MNILGYKDRMEAVDQLPDVREKKRCLIGIEVD